MLGKLVGGRPTSACVDVRRYPIAAERGNLMALALLLASAGNVLPLANVSRGSWERARVHAGKKSGTICRGPMTGGHF